MTAILDPIEESALIMLRAFLRGIEEGRFVVTRFVAADSLKELGMTIELGQRDPAEAEAADGAPSSSSSSSTASTKCIRCGSTNIGAGDTEAFCNACGATWPKA